MEIRKHFLFFLLVILACSNDQPTSLNGNWFISDYDYSGLLQITGDTLVTLDYASGPSQHELLKTGESYSIIGFDGYNDRELGAIEHYTRDRVDFANGFSLFRLEGKTKSSYSAASYQEYLKNTIWEYEFADMNTRLYLSDSLRSRSAYSATVVREGALDTGTLREPWLIENILDKQFLIHATYNSNILFLELNEGTDSSFTGYVYVFDEKFPVKGKKVYAITDEIMREMESSLINSDWNTISTRIYDFNENLPDSSEYIEMESVIEEWNFYTSATAISENEIDQNPYSFSFKRDGVLEVLRYGELVTTLDWHITKDGKYIFLYSQYFDPNYFETALFLDNPHSFSFVETFYIGDKENGVVQTPLEFTLQKAN